MRAGNTNRRAECGVCRTALVAAVVMVGASGSGFAVGFPEHCGRRLQQRAVVVVVLNLQSFCCRGGYTHKCEELASVGSGAPARLPAAF